MKSLYSQYNKVVNRFNDKRNKALDKLARKAAEAGGDAAKRRIEEVPRILTGHMLRQTYGSAQSVQGAHLFKIRSRAINDKNGFNYSFTQNSGTLNAWGRGIKVTGINFMEYGRDYILEKVINDSIIRSTVNKSWSEA